MLTYSPVRTFKEANMALCCSMPCNADYPYPEYDVIKVDGDTVTLEGGVNKDTFNMTIIKGKTYEYVKVKQSGAFEKMTGNDPTEFIAVPIIGRKG